MANNHIIPVKYSQDGYSKTRAVYQFDYGQVLKLEGFPEGMLPDPFEMHFSVGSGVAKTMIGTNAEVAILDECLTNNGTIAAWLFLHDAVTDGETKYTIEIPVRRRAKVINASPTPVQQDIITQTIAALTSGVEHVDEIAEEMDARGIPSGGASGKVLAKASNDDYDVEWVTQSGGGTSDYSQLSNKPKINNVELSGNKSLSDLGAAAAADVSAKYTKPSGGIPASDLASGVIPDVTGKADKADTVLTSTLSRGRRANTTVGTGSIAFGNDVVATGNVSQAVGYRVEATGTVSHSEGYYTKATGGYSHVSGMYNVADSYDNWPDFTTGTTYAVGDKVKTPLYGGGYEGFICLVPHTATSFKSTNWEHQGGRMNYAEIVGNGTADNARSNARTLDWSGNETLAGDLTINKGAANETSVGALKTAVDDKIDEPSSEGTSGQVLTTDGQGGRTWTTVQGGGGGTTDYSALSNKPQINSVTLSGNKSLSDLGIAAASAIPDVTGKADKVTSATSGHFAGLDSNGNLTDSGKKASDFLTSHQDISSKADKVTSATSGNFAALDSNGNLTDSGHKHSDYLTSHQDISGKVNGPSSATNNAVAIFDGTTGKTIKDSGYTIGKSVPSDAVFTDTTYESKSASSGGTAVSLVTTGEKYTWNNKGTYSKPSGGIPSTDMASAVQTSLGKADTAYQKPSGGIPSTDIASGVIPVLTDLIDDTAGSGDTTKVWSADKSADANGALLSAIQDKIDEPASEGTSGQVLTTDGNGGRSWTTVQGGGTVDLNYVTPEMYGAIGDGTTDDSQAVQDACDAGYAVYFGSNKTYYLASAVTIDHDIHLFGGEGATIKTVTPSGGMVNDAIIVTGTLKKTTTLTTDYSCSGSTANSGNQFTLTDMTDIEISDLLVIEATDQYYNYSRAYYHLGAVLVVGDIYNNHLYTTDSMPYDITNTANVSVKVYSAPTAVIENLNFVSDLDSRGNYKYCLKLDYCKNSVVKNCNLTQMDNGIRVYECANTLIDCVSISKSKYDNSLSGDGYGIGIYSSSETIIQRVESICSQSCITLSGSITNLNTFIRNCNIASECRANSIGSHENCYNTVIEDCVVTQVNVLGTAEINRCRFIKNNRLSTSTGITFCGSHNPAWATLKVRDCIFEDTNALIYLYASTPQDPVQSFDNIFGLVEIKNCDGGRISFTGTTSTTILSNRIKRLSLYGWTNCYEFYRPDSTNDVIEKMSVADCTFGKNYWISDHNDSHGMILTNIYDLDYRSSIPAQHKISVSKNAYAEQYTLPENVSINLSATNSTTAKYVICGNNLASDNPDDWVIGTVSGSDGGTLSRTASTSSSKPVISNDTDGNIVHTQQNNSSSYDMYPVGLFYVHEACKVKMSATLTNTGATTGASFRPLIAVVDCSTGNLVSRYSGTAVQATSAGASISYEHGVNANCVAMCYFYCSSAVANAVTTFEGYKAYIENYFAPVTADSIMPYVAIRRTGDGSVLSMAGVNNIMSSETTFNVSFSADYINNPIGVLPYGTGVSF